MSVGTKDIKSRKKVNLTQLCCNTKPRNQKKSGRKAPCPGDYDVFPAPDSESILEKRNEASYFRIRLAS